MFSKEPGRLAPFCFGKFSAPGSELSDVFREACHGFAIMRFVLHSIHARKNVLGPRASGGLLREAGNGIEAEGGSGIIGKREVHFNSIGITCEGHFEVLVRSREVVESFDTGGDYGRL